MEETGSIVPVNTILNLINQGSTWTINQHNETIKNSQRTVKESRKELRNQYKDFNDYAEEFDAIVEDINPGQITKDGLKIIFDSLRGKKLDKILEEQKRAKTAEEIKIVGEVGRSSAMVSTGPKTTKLTEPQKIEMRDMGFETEEDYFGRLDKKREIAKKRGAKNVPDLLSDILKY